MTEAGDGEYADDYSILIDGVKRFVTRKIDQNNYKDVIKQCKKASAI